jgi:hypothetical protein
MRLSSRKQLLKESEKVLKDIRLEIQKSSIDENFEIGDLFKNLVTSIIDIVSKKYKKIRQSYYQNKLPYLIGIDLINRGEIKISQNSLKKLENILSDLIKDINSSSLLQTSISQLEKADKKVYESRYKMQIIKFYKPYKKKYSPKELEDLYKSARSEYEIRLKVYNNLLENKVKQIIEDILRDKKYKNFEEMILKSLKSGIRGVTEQEMNQIKNNYLKVVSNRVSEYINNEKIRHSVTSWETGYSDTVQLPDVG